MSKPAWCRYRWAKVRRRYSSIYSPSMEALKVPGLSVAVIDDFKLAWTKAYGVTETGPSTFPSPQRLFFKRARLASPWPRQARFTWLSMGSCRWMRMSTKS